MAHEDNGKECEGYEVDKIDGIWCRHLVGREEVWLFRC